MFTQLLRRLDSNAIGCSGHFVSWRNSATGHQPSVGALLIVHLLELIVKLDPGQLALEELHELLVVDSAGAINVCTKSDCQDFAIVKLQGDEVGQALDVLEWLQEAFIVFIKFAEKTFEYLGELPFLIVKIQPPHVVI